MGEPFIRFPIKCAKCGDDSSGEYAVAYVASALLTKGDPLILSAPCHENSWAATDQELEQIREYLGAVLSSLPPPSASLHR